MSKKNKNKNKNNNKEFKKSQKKKAFILSKDFTDVREKTKKDDGFLELKFTPEGKRRMTNVRQKMSAKVFSATDAEEAERKYDPKPVKKILDTIEDMIKDGKYKKASKVVDEELISGFIEEYDKLDKESINWEKMNSLARRIITIGKSYYEYNDDQDVVFINDKTYDGLLAKYLSVEGNVEPMGIIPKGSKNQQKVEITYPSLHNNMDKAYSLKDHGPFPKGVKERDSAEAFLWRTYKALGLEYSQEIELELSPKIDGASINGTIVGNSLRNPQTRGDAEESIAVLGLDNTVVTKHGGDDEEFGIQYELFVTEEDRIKVSEYLKLDSPYVSCRHAAAGILHRLSTMEDDNLINFISLYPINSEGLDGTYLERMDYLQNYGIVPKSMPKRKVIKGDLNELLTKINKYYEKLQENRASLGFAIDGMVITVADDDAQEKIGRSGRTNKYQIAFKFDPSTITSKVRGIHLDIGKKGYRTVQVDVDPVYLDGVKYDHIPVPTADAFEDMELCEGDVVEIHRVGDVIPALTVAKRGHGDKIDPPKKCPVCGHKLIVHKKRYYCDNTSCGGNIGGKFLNFFEKIGLDGYGDAFCKLLHDELKCNTFADLLKLNKKSIEDAGVTSKLALEFPEELKSAIKKRYDYEIIGAMGIPGVAAEKARILLDGITNKHNNHNIATEDYLYELVRKAVGPKQADAVYAYVTTDEFINDIKELNKFIDRHSSGGKRIRVGHTGTTIYDRTRDICEKNNFDITDGSNFDILITNDMNSETMKMKKAKKNNLPIYLQWEFNERYEVDMMDPNTNLSQCKELKLWKFIMNNREPLAYFLQIVEAVTRYAIKALGEQSDDRVESFEDDKPEKKFHLQDLFA